MKNKELFLSIKLSMISFYIKVKYLKLIHNSILMIKISKINKTNKIN